MAKVYATVNGTKQAVNVNAAGKTTSNLPVGSVVHTAGGDYKITGGTAGNYTSTKVATGYADINRVTPTVSSGKSSTGYADINKVTPTPTGYSSSSKSSSTTATLPTGQTVGVDVNSAGKTVSNLPVGSIVHTAGGDYRITGGSPGNYSSTKVMSAADINRVTPSVSQSTVGGGGTGGGTGSSASWNPTPSSSIWDAAKSVLQYTPGVTGQVAGVAGQAANVTQNAKEWLNTPLPGVTQPTGVTPGGPTGMAVSGLINQFKPTTSVADLNRVSSSVTPATQTQTPVPSQDVWSLGSQTGGGQITPQGYGSSDNTMGATAENTMAGGTSGDVSGTYNFKSTQGTQPTQSPTVTTATQMPFDPEKVKQEMYAAIDAAAQQNAVLAETWMNSMISTIDQLQSQIQQKYTEMGSTLDPATTAALKQIRDDVDQRRQTLMEEMNRRGLLQSGIWLTEENKILNNQLTAEETLLANRLSDLQNKLVDSMMQFAQQRINIMGTTSQNLLTNQQWAGTQKVSALGDINARVDQWNQWWAEQQAAAKEAAQKQSNWQAEYNLSAQKAQQTNELGWAKLQVAQSKATDSATKRYIAGIQAYGSRDEAMNGFNQYYSAMVEDGADTNLIRQAIYDYFG